MSTAFIMANNGYELGTDRYIRRTGESKILGRASGNIPGGYWYQIAAKPYDLPEKMGYDSLLEAFRAAVHDLERRRIES